MCCPLIIHALSERAVQTFKLGIRKQLTGTLQTKQSHFLFHHRLASNITCVAPAELLLTRRPRSHLQQQLKQKTQHDKHSKSQHFIQGDLVFICEFNRGTAKPTRLPGTVIQQDGGPNYKIKLSDNQVIRRYADHICAHGSDCEDATQHEEMDDEPSIPVIRPTLVQLIPLSQQNHAFPES